MFYSQLLLQLLSMGFYLEILIHCLPGYICMLELILNLIKGLQNLSIIKILVSTLMACYYSLAKSLAL
jgi:hypothetical protein